MNELTRYIPIIFHGLFITLAVWICSAFLSFSIGIFLGFLSTHQITSYWLEWGLKIYAFIAKGIPAFVQILIVYFLLPSLFNITIPGFLAAVLALAFCSSGYVFEIVRSGINSIPKGQWDACYVLGYSKQETIMRIIAPQVFSTMLPAFIGELEQLLKSTSLCATIGVVELTRTGMNIISRELNPVPVYLLIAFLYLIFSFFLLILSLYIEKKQRRRYGQN